VNVSHKFNIYFALPFKVFLVIKRKKLKMLFHFNYYSII